MTKKSPPEPSTTEADADRPPLSPKQEQAAALLAQGKTAVETAQAVGVARQTVSGWKRNPLFAQLLAEKTATAVASAEAAVAEGREAILRLVPKTASMLEEALEAETAVVDGNGLVHTMPAWSTRLRAGRLVLQTAGLMVTVLEHQGEVSITGLTDEELDSELKRLTG
jgi:hypothetical protein